jgi:CubicO group peptidase (beta-lactamase class C family)
MLSSTLYGTLLISFSILASENSEDKTWRFVRTNFDPLLESKKLVGVTVGITCKGEHSIHGFGKTSLGENGKVPDGRTLFEIGSVTKVFTAIALADMVERGDVNLADPLSKFYPDQKTPNWKGHEITLESLATHRSGLPRLPNAILVRSVVSENPYAKFTAEDMRKFLAMYRLKRDVGAEYEYSNLGAGLLGVLLARKNGTDYETMIVQKICTPLKLSDTRITLTDEQQARLASPYYSGGEPAKNWDFDAFAGAGALRSTAEDMLTFLDANLGIVKTPLADALALCQEERTEAGHPGLSMGLGWHILKGEQQSEPILWHNGGTGGYRSFVGFCPKGKVGVVVLANTDHDVDSIAVDLLRKLAPSPPKPAKQSP